MKPRSVFYCWFFSIFLLLLVCASTAPARAQNSADFASPYNGVQPTYGSRPLLVILLKSTDPNFQPVKSRDDIRSLIFGATNSVRSYYLENSYGQFTFDEAYTTDWLIPNDDPTTAGWDETSSNYLYNFPNLEQKGGWVIQQVEALTSFTFGAYDSNLDGLVTSNELAVLWVYPESSLGRERDTIPSPVPVPSLSGGVMMPLARVADGDPQFVPLVAHELGHVALGLDDLYDDSNINYIGNSVFTLMSYHQAGSHLDPWSKIKLGWLNPTVVTQDGWYVVHDIETYPEAYILYDPTHGTNEYFIVENRFPGVSAELGLPDQGLGIWHIDENWSGDYWGRRSINLEWATGVQTNPSATTGAFWDGYDPTTAYDFTPFSSPANSQWVNGTMSNISIFCIPPAAPTVQVFFDVPPLRSGQTFMSAPTAINAYDGSMLDVFALGVDGYIYENVYTRNTDQWGAWTQIPSGMRFLSAPAAVNAPDGSVLDVFASAQDGYIYEDVYERYTGSWSGWSPLPAAPSYTSTPAVINSPDGTLLDVFALGDDGVIYQIVYYRGGGGWSAWTALPAPQRFIDAPAVVNSPDGTLLDVFALGDDGYLYELVYDRGSSSWNDWTWLPSTQRFVSAPAVVNAPDGSVLDVFALGDDGNFYELTYYRGGGGWGDWTALPVGQRFVSAPAVANAPDGSVLDVFALAANGALYETVYYRGGGGWSEWFDLTSPTPTCAE